jgi:glycosyltransferase involved in cell wall biosynthesis
MRQNDCAQALQNADAMVLPSLMECGGAVVLEAMACGLPVIATDWGGPADYLDPSCGIWFHHQTGTSSLPVCEAMVRLARDPVLRQTMGQAGRAKVEREFDWEAKVDRMLKLYERACATGSSSSSPQHV